mgnify:CR=1 FL=1
MRELGDPRLIARTLLDTETGANAPYSDAGSAYEQKSGSERVKQKVIQTGLFDLVWQVARDPDRCDRSGRSCLYCLESLFRSW